MYSFLNKNTLEELEEIFKKDDIDAFNIYIADRQNLDINKKYTFVFNIESSETSGGSHEHDKIWYHTANMLHEAIIHNALRVTQKLIALGADSNETIKIDYKEKVRDFPNFDAYSGQFGLDSIEKIVAEKTEIKTCLEICTSDAMRALINSAPTVVNQNNNVPEIEI